MLLNVNSLIGNYRVISLLGRGGMGEVYLAEHELLGRKVALKILNPMLTSDTQFVDRFKQEAKVQANLKHLYLTSLHDFIVIDGKYIMAMEYATGITLKEFISKTGPIPEERAVKTFKQIVDGVNYAHSQGIVHRDLKPSNIMRDEYDNVKILDFGIAKIVGSAGMTRTGSKMGTLYYMSPEQVKSLKNVDHRTDIYSLGITLFEMLTGKVPFDSNTDSDFEIMSKIVNDELPDPRDIYPHISEKYVGLIEQMTAKNREERPASLEEVSSILMQPDSFPQVSDDESKQTSYDEEEDEDVTDFEEETPEPESQASYYNEDKPKKKTGWILFIMLILGIGGYLAYSELYMKVPVPNLRGLALEEARARLNNADLQAGNTTEKQDNSNINRIISHTPSWGKAKRGSWVDLVVGTAEEVSVPNVIGMTLEQARNRITNAGLEVGQTTERRDNNNIGKVISSSPSSGEVKRGSSIDLVVGIAVPLNIEMIRVSGGTFQMGSNDGRDNEKPVHRVTLSDFYIGKYEVTQQQYQAVMGSNPSHFKGDNLPVEKVSWYNAIEFCNKLSIREGLTPVYSINGNTSPNDWTRGTIVAVWNENGYRLPTESEWEYAARGGNKSRGFIYSGSNSIGDVAWYSSNSDGRTHPVGTKRANELGIYDMSGNVWEWCWDWYGEYSSSAKTNLRGPANGSSAVLRGGSWFHRDYYCRVAYRSRINRSSTFNINGFRVARTRL